MRSEWLGKTLIAGIFGIVLSASATTANEGQGPHYGGTLTVGTVNVTLSPLSWDPYDWNWKLNEDAGMYLEQLFAADLDKSVHKGGKYPFYVDGWLPSDAIRGELAESWEWSEDPLALVIHLRKGIMFPDKPGVMKSRELTAEDVVFSYVRQNSSPKKIEGYFDHIEKVEARDRYTVIFQFKEYSAEWDYRFGWGFYSAIIPKELADAGATNWKNAVGTGPFQLTDYIAGNSQIYEKNSVYWDKEKVDGVDYKLPFVKTLVYRIIKDEATQHAALRTGKLDILEIIRWTAVDSLKQSSPQLQWSKRLSTISPRLSMRTDTKPFDDIRVRRALNMAVNKQEIVKDYYGGNAELFAYPMHPDYVGYYQPLSEMPDSVKELFTYDPKKAKKLLAEAGYPNGFSFKVEVCSCAPDNMDLLPLVAGYLEQIGVKLEIQPMEYGAYLSAMTSKTHTAGYFTGSSSVSPTTTLRKDFTRGQIWNPSMWNDPAFDAKMTEVFKTRDEGKRRKMLREMTVEILDRAPYVWLPTPYVYAAWWPWVKNYGGELSAGAIRPGPIYARIWIDEDMKKKMGF
jgi:peptide/nickel transport system substrate-binding protein